MLVSFDVSKVPARLDSNGVRDVSRPQWSRVTVYIECVWARPITQAALWAALMAGTQGMVTDVLYLE